MKMVFAGSFDPPTLGHLDLIQRGAKISDELIVVVAQNSEKKACRFSVDERVSFLKMLTSSLENVRVACTDGLIGDLATDLLLRGIRTAADLEKELALAEANRNIFGLETLFLPSLPQYAHISSSLLYELARGGKRLKGFVPDAIEEQVFQKFSNSP